eukprot:Nk52_evm8s1360 gene=Nk52_evmTU8s1360
MADAKTNSDGVASAIAASELQSAQHYELLDLIGKGATASVYSALCKPLNEKVAIKCIDLEKYGANIDELRKEIQVMSQCNHPNVVTYYTSFVVKEELWLVMRLLHGGSALDIMKYAFPKGLEENLIITILKEVLKALEYFHKNGQIHRDVKAGNILIDTDGLVQLADFGVSSWLVENGERKNIRQTFVGTPCWMAPEVMEQVHGYDYKADIWSFGITAIELASGHAPFAKYPPMKVLMLTLQNPPPTLDLSGQHSKYSKAFKKMIDACLQKDPTKRPTATELLKFPIFSKAKGLDYIRTELIAKIPELHARVNIKQPVEKDKTSQKVNSAEEWDFEPTTEEESKKGAYVGTSAKGEGTPAAKQANEARPEAVAEVDRSKEGAVINLKLRLRDREHQLKDVRFTFTVGEDTAEGIAEELVEAGLVDDVALDPIKENMQVLLEPSSIKKEVRFPLGEASDNADPDTLEGFAQLCIQ